MFYLESYSKQIEDIKKRCVSALTVFNVGYENALDALDEIEDRPTRLVLVGFYNAGKSSIAKMLTQDSSIVIDSKVSTDKVTSYPWNGLLVTDTPGIDTGIRPEHDKETYSAIAASDMLIYVVSNELFGIEGGEDFHKLAIDNKKAGEMILVVNKMARETYGNTPESQAVLTEALKKHLEPYSPEYFRLCFLDADSYLRSVKEREIDPEEADDLLEESGYKLFISKLNDFVEAKGYLSRKTTQLFKIDKFLDDVSKELDPESVAAGVALLEENLRRKKDALLESRNSLQDQIRSICTKAASDIQTLGIEAVGTIVEGCSQEAVASLLEKNANKAETIYEKAQNDAIRLVEKSLELTDDKIIEIDKTEITKRAILELNLESDSLPEGINNIIKNAGPSIQNISKEVLSKAYKDGVYTGMKLHDFSGSPIHEGVKKVGKAVKKKFKPCEALKFTRGVAYGAHILNAFGVILPIVMQVKEDKDAAELRNNQRIARQNIRGTFLSYANDITDYANYLIDNFVNPPLSEMLQDINSNLIEISETKAKNNKAMQEINDIRRDCHRLIGEIQQSEKSNSFKNHVSILELNPTNT